MELRLDLRFTGERIKNLRLRRGESQVQFAASAGVTQGTVSLWESDTIRPEKPEILERLLELEAANGA